MEQEPAGDKAFLEWAQRDHPGYRPALLVWLAVWMGGFICVTSGKPAMLQAWLKDPHNRMAASLAEMLAFVLFITSLLALRRFFPGKNLTKGQRARLIRLRRERWLTQEQTYISVSILIFAGQMLTQLTGGPGQDAFRPFTIFAQIVTILCNLMFFMGISAPSWRRAVLNDELTRAHRAMALRSAFAFLTIGTALLAGTGSLLSKLPANWLMALLDAAMIVFGLHFLILQRRADG